MFVLVKLHNIQRSDAILSWDENGNPYEPDWPEADTIIGNPPYLGSRKIRPTLGDEYSEALLSVYADRMQGLPDLVCYWFEKARAMIENGATKRAGLLGTQAIRGGSNRQVLDRIKDTGDIFMAWSDREWTLDGASVHVSILGFDDGITEQKVLDGENVEEIFSDLTAIIDLSDAVKLDENKHISFQGIVTRGPFEISAEVADKMLGEKGNPNGRPNSDVIRMRSTGKDLAGVPSNTFVIDFGIDTPKEDAAQYTMPFEHLKKFVYPVRQEARQEKARDKWWIHWNPRKTMRSKLSKLDRYLATSRHGKHRIFAWLDSEVLPDSALVVFARSDDYFFGVLHSRAHELWARRKGTQVRDAQSGFRYTPRTVFMTFPLPWAPGTEPAGDPKYSQISDIALELNDKRQSWLQSQSEEGEQQEDRTLTALYNENPTWLSLTHEKLDEAVLDAYGWSADMEEGDLLSALLKLNRERSKQD